MHIRIDTQKAYFNSDTVGNISEENIRIIFGLKVKELRSEKKLSLTELSNKSGLSVSYLNEIEKGKKYPKSGKIVAISEALSVGYDELVSLKLENKLAPIGKLLQSGFFEEFPLDLFGIELSKLIEIVSKAPAKVSAFISTLTELSRNFKVSTEHFYKTALRSYQELHGNYFEEIELAAESFIKEFGLPDNAIISSNLLADILQNKFGYIIDYVSLADYPDLENFRYILTGSDLKTIRINPDFDDSQRAFILARQLGFCFMKLKDITLNSPLTHIDSFEQVLSNFYASYFAGAV
ncbi:MAG: hypothetical protein RIS47_52, partial [Bacteroidota bacterium]